MTHAETETVPGIFLGACAWDLPIWDQTFYPPDLPTDWRLAYYNTQFGCVFLSMSFWMDRDEAEMASWLQDVRTDFLFLCEVDRGAELPGVIQPRAVSISRNDARVIWFDAASDLRALSEQIRDRTTIQPRSPLFLLSSDGDMGQMERVRTLLNLLGLHGGA